MSGNGAIQDSNLRVRPVMRAEIETNPILRKLAEELGAQSGGDLPDMDHVESAALLDRGPTLMRESIERICNEAATAVIMTAEAVVKDAMDALDLARKHSEQLRAFGKSQGLAIERSATLARDSAALSRAEMAKIAPPSVEGQS